MEGLYGAPVWNEFAFDARIFRVWLNGGNSPVVWTPFHVWVWSPPAGAQPWTPINLRDYCMPQSYLLILWNTPIAGSPLVALRVFFFSLFVGPLLLIWTVARNA